MCYILINSDNTINWLGDELLENLYLDGVTVLELPDKSAAEVWDGLILKEHCVWDAQNKKIVDLRYQPHLLISNDADKQRYIKNTAKQNRDAAISAPLSINSAEYQMTDSSIANIERAIRIAERESLPDSTVRKWRLADNTWRDTTLAEIKQLQIDYDNRFQAVWQAYNLWTEGDQAEDFNYEH